MSDMESSPGKCDAHDVSTRDLEVGWCESLTTAAVSISRLPDQNCVFKIFRGDGACGVDATDMVSWARSQSQDDVGLRTGGFQRPLLTKTMSRSQVNVTIPSGQGEICLVTGVTDGGKFAVCSGMLACGL